MAKLKTIAGANAPFLACIRTRFPNDTTVGTGTLVGRRLLLTAGHVVFDPAKGGKPHQFIVTIGRAPRITISATGWLTTSEWAKTDSKLFRNAGQRALRALSSYDMGAVVLNRPLTSPTMLPVKPVDPLSGLNGVPATVAGYSTKKGLFPNTALIAALSGSNMQSAPGRLRYPVATVGGMSGGPVWTFQSNTRSIRAIHTSKYRQQGNALILNAALLEYIQRWQRKFP